MNIKLSIICATYNHEKFLRRAIEGILIQQIDFQVEILIGEDCSTDSSRQIWNEYEKQYPNLFTIFYREKNYGPIKNFDDLYYRAKGEYIIILETDDFWTNELKLQKQVDYLDSHPDVFQVSHRCIMIDENGNPLKLDYPQIKHKYYSYRDYRNGKLPGQTTSIMFRNFYREEYNPKYDLVTKVEYEIGPGDRRRAFIAASENSICLPDAMSSYRFVRKGGSSFTANNNQSIYDIDKFNTTILKYCQESIPSDSEAYLTGEFCRIRDLAISYLTRKDAEIFSMLNLYFKKSKYKFRITVLLFIKLISIVLKKPFHLNAEYQKVKNMDEILEYIEFEKKIDFLMKSEKSLGKKYSKEQ